MSLERTVDKEHGYSTEHHGHEPCAGALLFAHENQALAISKGDPNSNNVNTIRAIEGNVAAYYIGEYIAENNYEIVTAWVDKRYSGMGIAVKVIEEGGGYKRDR